MICDYIHSAHRSLKLLLSLLILERLQSQPAGKADCCDLKVYTPSYPDVMDQFGVSSAVAVLGLSLYVLGLAFGLVLAAPISETQGRRAVYLISIPIAALFTLGAGLSRNMTSLVTCRFFASFFV